MGVQDGSPKRCKESWGQGLTSVRSIQNLDVRGDMGLRECSRFPVGLYSENCVWRE